MPGARHAKKKRSIALPKWGSKELLVYNGFTHSERVRKWQLGKWLSKAGLRDEAKQCEVCGSCAYVKYHSEDYYDPFAKHALCRSCHIRIHRRFDWKNSFIDLQARVDAGHWLRGLQPTPVDIAGRLRQKHGPEIADIHARFMAGITLPDDLSPPDARSLHSDQTASG